MSDKTTQRRTRAILWRDVPPKIRAAVINALNQCVDDAAIEEHFRKAVTAIDPQGIDTHLRDAGIAAAYKNGFLAAIDRLEEPHGQQ